MDTIDPKVHEEMHKRYTQRLAEAMEQTKEAIIGQILSGAFRDANKPSYIVEVDFDE